MTSYGPGRAMAIGAAVTVVCNLPVFFIGAMAVQLTDDLNFGTVGIGTAVGGFFGVMALGSMFLGKAADRLGASLSLRVAAIGAALSAFGTAALSSDWLSLALYTLIAGLAAALGQPAANRLLVNRVPLARLGVAFGLKQSAAPAASLLAGLSVPAIALTIGWRWAYVLAGLSAAIVALAVGRRPSGVVAGSRVPGRKADRTPLRDRPLLLLLGTGFGLAFAASSTALTFYVDAAARAGTSQQYAGLALAVASLAAIATRLLAGVACDRLPLGPLWLCTVLLGAGTAGIALLASGRPTLMAIGLNIALAGTWGFPGVFWYALVRAYPQAPGRVTGVIAPAAIGGIVGPIAFGGIATTTGFAQAWSMSAVAALLATVAMGLGARRLSTGN